MKTNLSTAWYEILPLIKLETITENIIAQRNLLVTKRVERKA